MAAAVTGRARCSGARCSAGTAESEPSVALLPKASDACGWRSAPSPTAASPPAAAPCTRRRAAGAFVDDSSALCGGPSAAGKLVRGKVGSDVALVRRAKQGMLAYSDSMLERVDLPPRQRSAGKVGYGVA